MGIAYYWLLTPQGGPPVKRTKVLKHMFLLFSHLQYCFWYIGDLSWLPTKNDIFFLLWECSKYRPYACLGPRSKSLGSIVEQTTIHRRFADKVSVYKRLGNGLTNLETRPVVPNLRTNAACCKITIRPYYSRLFLSFDGPNSLCLSRTSWPAAISQNEQISK